MWKKLIEKFTFRTETAPVAAAETEATTAEVETPTTKPHYFRSDRFFFQSAVDHSKKGRGRDGWYFLLRGGEVRGPFEDRVQAQRSLNELIEEYQTRGFTARD